MGKKKEAALKGLSKKDRRKLEEREAEIAAELKRRSKKSEKKHGEKKKGKAPKPGKKGGNVTVFPTEAPVVVDAAALGTMTIGPEAPIVTEADPDAFSGVESIVTHEAEKAEKKAKHPHLEHLDEVARLAAIADNPDVPKKVRKAAKLELETKRAESEARMAAKTIETDAEIKARVQKKRAEREAAAPKDPKMSAAEDALEGETETEYQWRKKAERDQATTVEVVETEKGREFVAGVATEETAETTTSDPLTETFAKPSEAPRELEEGRNGYKIMMLKDGVPDPRTVRQYTRVTTFVGNIDDTTTLGQWEKRLLAVGISVNATEPRESTPFVSEIADLTHRRDVTIAKAEKADRKGKLEIGEVARITAAAEKEWRDAMNTIVDEALELAGRNDKAEAGTNLHTLTEISDAKGIGAVEAMRVRDEITANELASIKAYAARMERLGAKVIHTEAVVVSDDMKYAGRLDRIILAKLPELTLERLVDGKWEKYTRPADTRARRYVMDVKSGRVDLGAGKISRQLSAYALGDLYDLETGERSKHGASRDIALVFHLPQGAGTCAVYAVDLKEGTKLLKLSAEVRRGRTAGNHVINTDVDIADPQPGGVVLETETAAE